MELQAVTDQVAKIGTETDTTLKMVIDLKAIIDKGGPITQEVKEKMAALKAQVQKVDELVPDAAPPPPPPPEG